MSKVRGIESLETEFIENKRAKADVSDDSSEGTGEDDRLQKMAQAMKTVIEVLYNANDYLPCFKEYLSNNLVYI